MSELFDKPRRIIGAVFLGLALLMVVLGQTVLSPHLERAWYILYWLVCILFTLLAACIALVDLAGIKRVSRREHRDLIEETLLQIEKDKKQPRPPAKGPGESV